MLVIRKAEPRADAQSLAFIRQLAEYEKELQAVVTTEEDLLRDGYGDPPRYCCLMADWGGAPAGLAVYLHTYSTGLGRWGIYLADLVALPRVRAKGTGRPRRGE